LQFVPLQLFTISPGASGFAFIWMPPIGQSPANCGMFFTASFSGVSMVEFYLKCLVGALVLYSFFSSCGKEASGLSDGGAPLAPDSGSSNAAPDAGMMGSSPLVNCKSDKANPRCANTNSATVKVGSIGSGPTLQQRGQSATITGGFFDNETLYVSVGAISGDDQRYHGAVLKVDLTTGNRTLFSGYIVDPTTGVQTVGTGEDFGNLLDIQKGKNGLYALGTEGDPTARKPVLLRLTPRTAIAALC
jgi:hypothetical protein